jgi:radical SAM protein with 4Fe4S-binding SPASM domain
MSCLIGLLALNGTKSVMFAGEGEPLLHPHLPEYISWAKQNGIDVGVTTNGVLMTPKFIELSFPHLSWIKLSVNGGTKNVYTKIHSPRQKNDWNVLWSNIQFAVDFKKAKGLPIRIGVQSLLLPDNAATLLRLARLCARCGVDYLVIKPFCPHPLSQKSLKAIDYTQYSTLFSKLRKFNCSNFELYLRLEEMEALEREREYERCYSVPYFWAYIMATGDVYGCSAFLGDPRFKYGNVNEESFTKIWMGEKRKEAIKLMAGFDVGVCRKACRMEQCNRYLWKVKNPGEHQNFI